MINDYEESKRSIENMYKRHIQWAGQPLPHGRGSVGVRTLAGFHLHGWPAAPCSTLTDTVRGDGSRLGRRSVG